STAGLKQHAVRLSSRVTQYCGVSPAVAAPIAPSGAAAPWARTAGSYAAAPPVPRRSVGVDDFGLLHRLGRISPFVPGEDQAGRAVGGGADQRPGGAVAGRGELEQGAVRGDAVADLEFAILALERLQHRFALVAQLIGRVG